MHTEKTAVLALLVAVLAIGLSACASQTYELTTEEEAFLKSWNNKTVENANRAAGLFLRQAATKAAIKQNVTSQKIPWSKLNEHIYTCKFAENHIMGFVFGGTGILIYTKVDDYPIDIHGKPRAEKELDWPDVKKIESMERDRLDAIRRLNEDATKYRALQNLP